jgi:hypothetical protein
MLLPDLASESKKLCATNPGISPHTKSKIIDRQLIQKSHGLNHINRHRKTAV